MGYTSHHSVACLYRSDSSTTLCNRCGRRGRTWYSRTARRFLICWKIIASGIAVASSRVRQISTSDRRRDHPDVIAARCRGLKRVRRPRRVIQVRRSLRSRTWMSKLSLSRLKRRCYSIQTCVSLQQGTFRSM